MAGNRGGSGAYSGSTDVFPVTGPSSGTLTPHRSSNTGREAQLDSVVGSTSVWHSGVQVQCPVNASMVCGGKNWLSTLRIVHHS